MKRLNLYEVKIIASGTYCHSYGYLGAFASGGTSSGRYHDKVLHKYVIATSQREVRKRLPDARKIKKKGEHRYVNTTIREIRVQGFNIVASLEGRIYGEFDLLKAQQH